MKPANLSVYLPLSFLTRELLRYNLHPLAPLLTENYVNQYAGILVAIYYTSLV